MLVLGIETSCDTGLVFLGRGDPSATRAADRSPVERRFAKAERFEIALFAAVRELLDGLGGGSSGRPDLLAVGLGPGSYTGLRIGLAAVKGLALGWGIPIVGLASDRVLLAALPGEALRAVVVWPDRRGFVTDARFERELGGAWREIEPYVTRTPLEAAAGLDPGWALCGPGAATVAACDPGLRAASGSIAPDAGVVLRSALVALAALGADGSERLVPHYLRPVAPIYRAPPVASPGEA